MSVVDLRERHATAKAQVHNLRDQLRIKRASLLDTDVATYAESLGRKAVKFNVNAFRCCRTLQGHTGKIYSLDWSYRERTRIVSASQDGRLIVWNAISSQKTHAIKLPCAWVMACAFSPSGHAVACGGLDNVCSIFNLNSTADKDGNLPLSCALVGHKGYLSCCRYVPDEEAHIITSSGDHTCIMWDAETNQRIALFGGDSPAGHTSDVMSVSISASNSKMFVSGSCDMTAKLWDTRTSSCVRTFHGHDGDVNTVQFLPDGLHFGTGSDDGSCRLFDTRTGHELQQYRNSSSTHAIPGPANNVTSIAFSYSGRLLFAGYSNGNCYAWDTLLAEVVTDLGGGLPSGHSNRVSCLGVSSDGSALCTGSWDSTLKVWAYAGGSEVS